MWRFLCSTNRYKPRNQSDWKETTQESIPRLLRAPRSLALSITQYANMQAMGWLAASPGQKLGKDVSGGGCFVKVILLS